MKKKPTNATLNVRGTEIAAEFLGMWENLNNTGFRNRAGLNSFVLTPRQWIENSAEVGTRVSMSVFGDAQLRPEAVVKESLTTASLAKGRGLA